MMAAWMEAAAGTMTRMITRRATRVLDLLYLRRASKYYALLPLTPAICIYFPHAF